MTRFQPMLATAALLSLMTLHLSSSSMAQAAFTTPGGDALPASEDRMTLVLVRTPDGLRIAQGANVQIDPFAARFDPVKMRSNAG